MNQLLPVHRLGEWVSR